MVVGDYISVIADYDTGTATDTLPLLRGSSLRETEKEVKYRAWGLLRSLGRGNLDIDHRIDSGFRSISEVRPVVLHEIDGTETGTVRLSLNHGH